jgi:TRAP-type mannitol/chloroaromatic compound transport system permease small subunit
MRLRDGLYSKWPDELPGNEAKRKRSGLGGAKFPLFYGGIPVNGLLKLSSLIDGLTERVGKAIIWLVLVVTLIGAGNAVMRYIWNYSSNAFLEIQWYLFSAIFLFGAGYTLMRNEHVRIDLISGRLSPRGRAWIDIFGIIFFLLPMASAIMYLSWPIFCWHWPTTNSRAMPAASRCGRYACWCRSVSSCW